MKKIPWMLVALGVVLLLGPACVITVLDYSDSPGSRPRIEFDRNFAFASDGDLSLTNFDGNIEIIGWEEEQVEIYGEKFLHDWDRPRVQFFRWRDPVPQVDIDQFENLIRIKTLAPEGNRVGFSVDYYLQVPQSINLKDILARDGDILISDLFGEVAVELRSGNIQVENFSGTLKATVMDGNIQARVFDIRQEDSIRLESHSGEVVLYLQPEAGARIEAYAPNGEISSEFPEIKAGSEDRYSGEIGGGGAEVSLTAMFGDIRINKIPEEGDSAHSLKASRGGQHGRKP